MRQANNVALSVEPQGCPDIIDRQTKGSVQFGFRQVARAKPRRQNTVVFCLHGEDLVPGLRAV